MDKTIVGNNAGKVWYALKEIGEIQYLNWRED